MSEFIARNLHVLTTRAGDEPNTILVVASSADVDRYGDIVDQDSWQLTNYRANPVILFAHNSHCPPVGRAVVEVVEGKLLARILFDVCPENAMGRLMAAQYAGGFMSTVSVGFRSYRQVSRAQLPLDDVRRGDRGMVLYDNELLEISCVPIPANPKAVAMRGDDGVVVTRADGSGAPHPLVGALAAQGAYLSSLGLSGEVDDDMAAALMALHLGVAATGTAYLSAGKDAAMRDLVARSVLRAVQTMMTLSAWTEGRVSGKPATILPIVIDGSDTALEAEPPAETVEEAVEEAAEEAAPVTVHEGEASLSLDLEGFFAKAVAEQAPSAAEAYFAAAFKPAP